MDGRWNLEEETSDTDAELQFQTSRSAVMVDATASEGLFVY